MHNIFHSVRLVVTSTLRIPAFVRPGRFLRTMTTTRDPNTLSNYNEWKTKHTIADLAIDFKKQRLHGMVTLQLGSLTEKASEEIILDTSFLDIQTISVNGKKSDAWKVKSRSE